MEEVTLNGAQQTVSDDFQGLDTEQLERAAFILKSVAHPIRLGIVQLLEQEEKLSVNEICDAMDTEQSLTSHHLSNMKLKGILESKRSGKKVFYSLKLHEITSLLRCLEHCACKF